MAEKKWFGLAAAAAAIGGLAVLVKNKVKESPETFSAAFDTTKEKTKQAAQRVTGMFGDSDEALKDDAETDASGEPGENDDSEEE